MSLQNVGEQIVHFYPYLPLSSNNRMTVEIQETVDDCVKMNTSNILQEERAQRKEGFEIIQLLLNEDMALWNAICQQQQLCVTKDPARLPRRAPHTRR